MWFPVRMQSPLSLVALSFLSLRSESWLDTLKCSEECSQKIFDSDFEAQVVVSRLRLWNNVCCGCGTYRLD